jgi:acyl carrier protein
MSLQYKIEQILEFKIDNIKDNIKLTELGLDSLKIIELAGIIHEHTKIELKFKDVFKIDKKWILDLIKKYDKEK